MHKEHAIQGARYARRGVKDLLVWSTAFNTNCHARTGFEGKNREGNLAVNGVYHLLQVYRDCMCPWSLVGGTANRYDVAHLVYLSRQREGYGSISYLQTLPIGWIFS